MRMNVFLTSGTMDFMESLRKKYANEKMVVMHGKGNSLLLHETGGASVFQTPIRYEAIGSSGILQDEGFFALNNIPVTDEGRPIFEHRLLSHADAIEDEPGFIAHRLLRPLDSNTYVVLTQWSRKDFFDLWKKSSTYSFIIDEKGAGREKKPHMFSSAPYLTTYKHKKEKKD